MDPERFDQLTVTIAHGATRRTLLRLAGSSLAALLAGLGLGAAAEAKSCAKKCHNKKSRQARRKCRKRCQPPQPKCQTSADCPPNELCESGVCIPIPDQCTTNDDCDACERCDAGVCVTRCQPSEVCQNNECQPPQCTSDAQCGACERCAGGRCIWHCQPTEHCQGGQCVPGCTPTTCAAAGAECGEIPTGCGGTLDCGACTLPETCGGGNPGTPGVCGCTPITTCPGGLNCGEIDDGCGSTISCGGPCSNPTPICVDNICTACTSSDQCPTNTICEGGSCQACDVCASGCTYTTVQAAVAAGGPSTIYVCPGAYTENITIGRALTLIGAGQGSGAGDTILQGAEAGFSVVRINGGVGAGAVTLRSLRITGGTGLGAGVAQFGTTLTMTDCTVTGNSNTNSQGGGLFNGSSSTLLMTGCTVADNHANGNSGLGGGLLINGPATLTACTISGNSAGNNGGGIDILNPGSGPLTLDGGTVTGNTARNGGGIFNDGATVTLQGGATVTENEAGNVGGGIYNNGGTVTLQGGASVTGNFAPPGTPNNCAGTAIVGCSG